MKNMLVAAIAAMSLTSGMAFAQADSRPADHPCRKIEEACKAAGFVKGEAKAGKGLFKDCVGPIVHGKAVQGVTVDPSLGGACAAKEAEANRRRPRARRPLLRRPRLLLRPPRSKSNSDSLFHPGGSRSEVGIEGHPR